MTQSSSLENINTAIGLLNTKCNILSNNINNIPDPIPAKSKEYFRAGLAGNVTLSPGANTIVTPSFSTNVEYSSASILENGTFTAQRDGLYYIGFVPTCFCAADVTVISVSLLKSTDGGTFAKIQQVQNDFYHVLTTFTATTPIFGVHALLAGDRIECSIYIGAPGGSSSSSEVLSHYQYEKTNIFGFSID